MAVYLTGVVVKVFLIFCVIGLASANAWPRIKTVADDSYPCQLIEYLGTCTVSITDDNSVEVTVIVHHCHKPVDITFIVEAFHRNLLWRYTYVTTNPVELPEIHGLLPDHTVALHVQMDSFASDAVNIIADFFIDGNQNLTIMNTTVFVSTFEDCSHIGSNLTGRILLGVLLTFVLLLLCGFVMVYVYQHRSMKSDRFPLVDDAEAVARASTSFTLVANTTDSPSAASSPDGANSLTPISKSDSQFRSCSGVQYRPISDDATDQTPNIVI